MASTTQRKAFISNKLAFLKDQRGHFISAFGQYIEGIITAGESWTEGGDNKKEYAELCQTIDTVTMVLIEQCEELSSVSGRVEGSQLAWPPYELSDLTLTSPKATVSTSATGLVHSAGETQLKPILARIAVIEEALCSFRSNVEIVGKEQTGFDQQMKQIVANHSELKKKCSSKCKNVIKQVSEINKALTDLDEDHDTRLQSLEKQLQRLSKALDRSELEMKSQAELTEKLDHVPDQLESVKENLDVLQARIGKIIDDCSNKHQDIDNVMRDLEHKVMTTRETVQVISEGQGQEMILLKDLETGLQTLKADTVKSIKGEQTEKTEANFRILCQMLNDRLTPLEQLRTCLYQRANTRDDNIKQLTKVIQEVTVMSQRLQKLELKSSRTSCGFTAGKFLLGVASGSSLGLYDDLCCDVGNGFDAASGIFTAPIDGLYVAAISFYLSENEELGIAVRCNKQSLFQGSDWVCFSSSKVEGTTTCDIGVVDMKAGDTLVAHVENNNTTDEEQRVYFSFFLLA